MCGICGMFSSASEDRKKQLLIAMNRAQKHRGPDDEGIYIDRKVGLGHVRLSILDLSPAGHQPMTYQNRYTIVFNGEIYNYLELREELEQKNFRFFTETDTEVLLAAYACWGEACQSKLNGFWAFAVYDRQEKSLFLSRDRYGVKPLYYWQSSEGLLFASEIKTLLVDNTIPRIANDRAVKDYLINGFVDCSEETFFEGIFRLPAGYQAIVDSDGHFEKKPYYSLSYKETLTGFREDDVSKFRSLFQDSVRLRLRADVPVGSCLSGGLDSSAIVCETVKQLKSAKATFMPKTYSACYPGSPNDESVFVDAVNQYAGTESYRVEPSAGSLFEDLDHLIYMQDEPFVSTSMYASYCVMKIAHQHEAKVLLDGQGADEILCGYRKARVYYIKKLLEKRKLGKAIVEAVKYVPYMRKANLSLLADISMLRQFLGAGGKGDIRRKYLMPEFAAGDAEHGYQNSGDFLLNDFKKIVLPALLRYVDRNSMAFSIEDRLPFLDYRLVEFCMQLPLDAKISGGFSKYIMRQALDMPELIRARKDKIGFYTPEGDWLRQYSEEYRSIFTKNEFRAGKYIDASRIAADWNKLLSGKDDIGLFRYICLEKWMQCFNVSSRPAEC